MKSPKASVLAATTLAFLLLFGIAGNVSAGINQWTFIGPYGGKTQVVAVSPNYVSDQTVYAGVGGGVYKSTDGGGSWTAVNTGLPGFSILALSISPNYTSDQTVYAGTSSRGVYKSTNGGASWVSASPGYTSSSILALVISPNYASDQTVYIGIYSKVYKSTNGGASWVSAGTGLSNRNISALAISPNYTTDQTLFASASECGCPGEGVYKSTNCGATWAAVNTYSYISALEISPAYATDHTVYAGGGSGMYKSTSSGATWAPMNGPSGVNSLAISPYYATDQTIYAGTNSSGVYKSTNYGALWTLVNTGLDNNKIHALAMSPSYATDHTVFTGTDGGVCKSVNSGSNWAAANNGITGTTIEALAISPNYASDQTLFAGAYLSGAFKSTDGGASWDQFLTNRSVPAITISPNYTADRTIIMYGLKSTDGGASWASINLGADFFVISPNFASDNTIFGGSSSSGVVISVDGGATMHSNYVNSQNDVPALAISPNYASDQTIFAGTYGGGVFKSFNAGTTWTAVNTGMTYKNMFSLAISPNYATDQTVYTGAMGAGIFKSTNGGASWAAVNTGIPNLGIAVNALAISPNYTTDHTIYAGGVGVYKSTNDGTSWTAVNNGLTNTNVRILVISPNYAVDNIVYAATSSGVFVSTFSSPASSILSPKGGAYINGTTYAITGTTSRAGSTALQQVDVSTDGGATWFGPADGVTDTSGDGSWSTWSYNWTLPADGNYTILSRATDNASNVETPGVGVTVTADNTNPVSNITSPTSGATLSGTSYTIRGASSDGSGSGVQKVEVSIDGGAWVTVSGTTSWTYNWTLPTDGSHSISSRATDKANNVETSTIPFVTVTVDKIKPASTITAPLNSATLTGLTGTITGAATDTGSGVQKVDVGITPSGDATAWTTLGASATSDGWAHWSYTWRLPADGSYTIQSRATDNAGNVETSGGGVAVNVSHITGTVWAWGTNTLGQLGDGTTTFRYTPVQVSGIDKVTLVAGGGDHTIALKSDGTVWTWGGNSSGTLGDGTISDSYTPVQAVGLSDVTYIFGGCAHSVALKSDGTVWAWGSNRYGQLGDGTTTDSYTPKQVDGLAGMTVITSGDDNNLARKLDGTVWAWGSNGYGQLGDGTTSDRYTPVQVTGLTDVIAIACSSWHTTAVKSDGTVWAWGYNGDGRLGDGTTTDSYTPVQVIGLTDVTAIAGGSHHAMALKADGTVWAWGNNGFGQLGDGTTTDRNTPVQVPGLDGVTAIECGKEHSLALKSDGTVWAWGYNGDGELGDGTTTDRYAPVQVSGFTEATNTIAGGAWQTIAIQLETPSDTTPPASVITYPVVGAQLTGMFYTITGTASDGTGSGVKKVDVSVDGGAWITAAGTTSWSYDCMLSVGGAHTIQSRATDNAGTAETPGTGVTVTVDNILPLSTITTPSDNSTFIGTIFNITGTATDAGSGVQKVEVGITPSGGSTVWYQAAGTSPWSYNWTPSAKDMYNITSRATDNAGNIEVSDVGVTVNVAAVGSPELQHYNWDASLSGGSCAACHTTPNTFLPSGFRNDNSFCYSCHNTAGVSHEKGLYGNNHKMMVTATYGGAKMPTYGTITTSEYNDQPFSRLIAGKVVCVTCHNPMRKSEDMGRTWEFTTTADNRTFTMQNGGWSGYGVLVPEVYRDTSLWAGPTYSKAKKDYLVNPAEYNYNETDGTVTFLAAQDPAAYIYVSLDYPYLRASNAGNTLCTDCHTQATHEGNNCQTCHSAHNNANIKGIKESLRAPNRTSVIVKFLRYTGVNSFADGNATRDGICEVCHTTTKYYRRDGSGFATHSSGLSYKKKDCTSCHFHQAGFSKTQMVNLTSVDNGNLKVISVGNTVVVELVSQSDSGYNWHTAVYDQSRLSLARTETIPGVGLGAPATQRFYFLAIAPGDATLNLLEYRVWEGPGKALNSFGVSLHINP